LFIAAFILSATTCPGWPDPQIYFNNETPYWCY
jgi:hypothetical protein